MMKNKLFLIGRAVLLNCIVAFKVTAFIQPGSWDSCRRLPVTTPAIVLSAAFDDNTQKSTTDHALQDHNQSSEELSSKYYYMQPISDKEETDVDPAALEDDLLSQFSEMESMLQQNYVSIQPDDATEPFQEETSDVESPKIAAAIDKSIYQFNEGLVNTLSAIISHFYPTTSKSTTMISPLIGTEYNGDGKEEDVVLRFEKFYILETVARIPYFAYLSVLHVRESLGSRGFLDLDLPSEEANEKRIEAMRTHYAQADNELHHLLIMEALGGNSSGFDRLLAHTLAFGYYWFVMLVYLWNDKAAYHLNEIIEDHAYDTYDEFLAEHGEKLKSLPVPDIARKYYESDFRKNPHLFKAFCAVCKTQKNDARSHNRPHELKNLYDVFMNIRDDEKEHWMSLCNIVQYGEMGAVDESNVKSTEVRAKGSGEE